MKMAELWDAVFGRDTKPLIEYAYFALPVFPDMIPLLSEQELSEVERFINPALRISLLGENFLVLTVRDGAVWNEFTLETFLRAWELMLAWYRPALEELSLSGRVAGRLENSFSNSHRGIEGVTEENLEGARRLISLLVRDI